MTKKQNAYGGNRGYKKIKIKCPRCSGSTSWIGEVIDCNSCGYIHHINQYLKEIKYSNPSEHERISEEVINARSL